MVINNACSEWLADYVKNRVTVKSMYVLLILLSKKDALGKRTVLPIHVLSRLFWACLYDTWSTRIHSTICDTQQVIFCASFGHLQTTVPYDTVQYYCLLLAL